MDTMISYNTQITMRETMIALYLLLSLLVVDGKSPGLIMG